ncbi:ATP-binding protein [Ensifer adhaerens]|uniref:ATP-binding protein n=1 Tax=Ensifer adhaerens TaxID=106592 RepID=UPI003D07BA27
MRENAGTGSPVPHLGRFRAAGTGDIYCEKSAENNRQNSCQVPDIPEAERQRVFEAFYRLKPREREAGLGLNLVLQIAERHNGRISILTSPTGDACFRLAFGETRI